MSKSMVTETGQATGCCNDTVREMHYLRLNMENAYIYPDDTPMRLGIIAGRSERLVSALVCASAIVLCATLYP